MGAMIRGCDIKVVSVGAVVAYYLEDVFLRIGTLCISHINIRGILVDPFRQLIRLPMEVSLESAIIMEGFVF